MTMPSNRGTTKPCASDRASTDASAARIPSARPRASTGIRVAGRGTSEASTEEPGCFPAGTESAVSMEIGAATGVMAHRRTATSMGALQRARGAYAHFDYVARLFHFDSSGKAARRLISFLLEPQLANRPRLPHLRSPPC